PGASRRRQRDLPACRPAGSGADRGLHRDRARRAGPAVAVARSGQHDHNRGLTAARVRGGSMGLAVAIQMDPIDTINIDADSTFALALEAQARGHALYHYLPQALTLRDGRLYARGRPLEVFRRHGNHHRFGNFEELDLAGFDIVLMRQDPPFDMAYIT